MRDQKVTGFESYVTNDQPVRGVDPEKLRMLGKRASALYTDGDVSLTDAVVDVLREESGLNSEHVQRVVEAANRAAFSAEFAKSAEDHRVINFEDGPADPGKVLQELRSGDDAGVMKTASDNKLRQWERYVPGEDGFRAQGLEKRASAPKVEYPHLNPHRELFELLEAVKVAQDQAVSKLSRLTVVHDDAASQLCKEAREVILSGHSPAEVARIFEARSPNESLTKLALKRVRDVVSDIPAVAMEKAAGDRSPNPDHPLCQAFDNFVKVAQEYYATISAAGQLKTKRNELNKRVREVLQ